MGTLDRHFKRLYERESVKDLIYRAEVAYKERFGDFPPCLECVSEALQAEWWLQCVEENDPDGPIDRGYDALLKALPKGTVL